MVDENGQQGQHALAAGCREGVRLRRKVIVSRRSSNLDIAKCPSLRNVEGLIRHRVIDVGVCIGSRRQIPVCNLLAILDYHKMT